MDIFVLDCWTSYVSFVESIETCQKKSSNWCWKPLRSLAAFTCSNTDVSSFCESPWYCRTALHYFFALNYCIFPFDDRFGEFKEQWVFEDLLLHEMDIFLLDCWTSYVSFVESIETCQKKSSNWCWKPLQSLAAFTCSNKDVSSSCEPPFLFGRLYIVFCLKLLHFCIR